MTTFRDLQYSLIEYVPDPGNPDGKRIPLGVAFEVLVKGKRRMWWVGTIVRGLLAPGEIEQLDPIAAELLEHPDQFVNSLLKDGPPKGAKPGGILAKLAEQNPWSIRVTNPRSHDVKVPAGKSVKVAVEAEMVRLYWKHVSKNDVYVDPNAFPLEDGMVAAEATPLPPPPVWLEPRMRVRDVQLQSAAG